MNCSAFEALSLEEQVAVLENEVCLGEREEGSYRVLLYQVASFYTEAYYCKRQHTIHKALPFTCMEKLDPYLAKIKLEGSL